MTRDILPDAFSERSPMERKVFFALVAYTFLLLFLYLLYIIVSPFLAALGWAAVIVIATYPIYKRLFKLFRTKPTISAVIMTALVFLIIVIPATLLVGTLVREVTHAQQVISQWSDTQPAVTLDRVLNHPWVAPVVTQLQDLVRASNIDLKDAAIQGARRITSFLLDALRGAVMQAALFLFQLILILISLFFLYRDGPKLTKAFLSTLPIPENQKAHIHGTRKPCFRSRHRRPGHGNDSRAPLRDRLLVRGTAVSCASRNPERHLRPYSGCGKRPGLDSHCCLSPVIRRQNLRVRFARVVHPRGGSGGQLPAPSPDQRPKRTFLYLDGLGRHWGARCLRVFRTRGRTRHHCGIHARS